jgi:Rrf2 family protein
VRLAAGGRQQGQGDKSGGGGEGAHSVLRVICAFYSRAREKVYSIDFIVYFAAMISQKARYALRALLYLAAKGGDTPVQISEIAEAEGLPRKFLEQILLELKKPGIVRSARGRSGGYLLGRPAKQISFADVLRVTDGPLALSPCVSVMAYRKCDDCFDEAVCAIRKALLAARDSTAKILEARNLATAAAQLKRSGAL